MNTITAKSKEPHAKSIMKAISWRCLATSTTIIISLIITGSAQLAFSIGFIELFTKIVLYYLHERLWQASPRNAP